MAASVVITTRALAPVTSLVTKADRVQIGEAVGILIVPFLTPASVRPAADLHREVALSYWDGLLVFSRAVEGNDHIQTPLTTCHPQTVG
jgi:predicted nucleic acid-binding protein